MKYINQSKCELEIIECDCGFHLGLDATYLDQVSEIEIKCPSCDLLIDTNSIEYENVIDSLISENRRK